MLLAVLALPVAAVKPAPVLLDPTTIPKYVNQISGPPPVYVPVSGNDYEITAAEKTDQQILPTVDAAGNPTGFPPTKVWAYGGEAKDALTGDPLGFVRNSPAPSFEVTRGTPITVKWVNGLTGAHMFAVDPTLHWANPNMIPMPGMPDAPAAPFPLFPPGFDGTVENPPGFFYDAQSPVPMVVHVHGLEVKASSDGHPDAWWTANGMHGSGYSGGPGGADYAIFNYPNEQPATTLWYHDHALGITRINVMSGLAGFYLLRDPADTVGPLLPSGKYEVPLAIQDRIFDINGQLVFPSAGLNPTIHPYWIPEFFGNTIMVNGLVWPNMNVDRAQYRFRLLDGSNARFYTLSFSNKMPFTMIGTEGGYLKAPVTLTEVSIAPGERADILVDFSNIPAGTKIILQNTAKAPTPRGAPADPQTTGQIMQFTVGMTQGPGPQTLPTPLNPLLTGAFPTLPAPTATRILTLQEVMGAAGPVEVLLDGQKWAAPVSETPGLGSTEEWVIVNPTADTHPIHLHLAQFQLVSRQPFQVKKYQTAWMAINGMPPLPIGTATQPVNPIPYLQGKPVGAPLQEQGFKDTIQMKPGEVTTIRVRFAPMDDTPSYSFDATAFPGYVWHCHIIDHEDNEMMRPYEVV
ncbi:MAG: multicopper oxidase [Methanomicrobiales archaeon]|nr:multicopper oxidase [Methanomicrobiales archaeon]